MTSVGCGARTGLEAGDPEIQGVDHLPEDARPADGSRPGGPHPGLDSGMPRMDAPPPDAWRRDVFVGPWDGPDTGDSDRFDIADLGRDTSGADVRDASDVHDGPAAQDAPDGPRLDGPGADGPGADGPLPGCADDGSDRVIFVVTKQNHLGAFDPIRRTFTPIGGLSCSTVSTPFSMAVDRAGTAYVLYSSGELFRVSTRDASCSSTHFRVQPIPADFATFGMGFTTEPDLREALYVASSDDAGARLGRIDPDTLAFRLLAPIVPSIRRPELTGSGVGRLFAFYADPASSQNSFIAQVDRSTGMLSDAVRLLGVSPGYGWAFSYWGGDFYTFSSPNDVTTQVHRYSPGAGQYALWAVLPEVIVGAGVSTCAPG